MATLMIEHIESKPEVCGGRPFIAGRRVAVRDIVVLHEWHGWRVDQIADELELTLGQVYAALSYYHDHREEIQRSLRDEQDFIERYFAERPSKLQAKLETPLRKDPE